MKNASTRFVWLIYMCMYKYMCMLLSARFPMRSCKKAI